MVKYRICKHELASLCYTRKAITFEARISALALADTHAQPAYRAITSRLSISQDVYVMIQTVLGGSET